MSSQKDRILSALSDHEQHTSEELNRICYRYSARIRELREEGKTIMCYPLQDGTGLWSYFMPSSSR